MIIFRKATVWDLYDIVDMWRKMAVEVNLPYIQGGVDESEKFLLAVALAIKLDHHLVMVAEDDDNELLGFVKARIERPDYGTPETVGWGEAIYVLPEHRDGLGFELVDRCEEWFRSKNVGYIILETKHDEGLEKVWSRKGFKPCQTLHMKEVHYD
jgi:GNAT superfamily N-acetyltransferase